MRTFKIFLILLFFSCQAFTLSAQVKTIKPFKAPKLYSGLNNYRDSATITKQELITLIGMPLQAFDADKKKYKISSYQCLYKQWSMAKDEKTGKVMMSSTDIADRFKTTPLPDIWLKTIREKGKQGEEIRFFDVIAKDEAGRVMYAGDFVLKIR